MKTERDAAFEKKNGRTLDIQKIKKKKPEDKNN